MKLKKSFLLLCTLALIAVLAFTCTSCGNKQANKKAQPSLAVSSATETVGKGDTSFHLSVKDGKKEKTFIVKTNEETIGDALKSAKIVEGEKSEYGLYITSVDGVKYDYSNDGKYWAFYIDGEYAQTGVSDTPIEKEKNYSLVAEDAK